MSVSSQLGTPHRQLAKSPSLWSSASSDQVESHGPKLRVIAYVVIAASPTQGRWKRGSTATLASEAKAFKTLDAFTPAEQKILRNLPQKNIKAAYKLVELLIPRIQRGTFNFYRAIAYITTLDVTEDELQDPTAATFNKLEKFVDQDKLSPLEEMHFYFSKDLKLDILKILTFVATRPKLLGNASLAKIRALAELALLYRDHELDTLPEHDVLDLQELFKLLPDDLVTETLKKAKAEDLARGLKIAKELYPQESDLQARAEATLYTATSEPGKRLAGYLNKPTSEIYDQQAKYAALTDAEGLDLIFARAAKSISERLPLSPEDFRKAHPEISHISDSQLIKAQNQGRQIVPEGGKIAREVILYLAQHPQKRVYKISQRAIKKEGGAPDTEDDTEEESGLFDFWALIAGAFEESGIYYFQLEGTKPIHLKWVAKYSGKYDTLQISGAVNGKIKLKKPMSRQEILQNKELIEEITSQLIATTGED